MNLSTVNLKIKFTTIIKKTFIVFSIIHQTLHNYKHLLTLSVHMNMIYLEINTKQKQTCVI